VRAVRRYNFSTAPDVAPVSNSEESRGRAFLFHSDELLTGLCRLGRFAGLAFFFDIRQISGMLPLSVTIASETVFYAC
jgi:hypothetical protein